jgi:hypothetical protein
MLPDAASARATAVPPNDLRRERCCLNNLTRRPPPRSSAWPKTRIS